MKKSNVTEEIRHYSAIRSYPERDLCITPFYTATPVICERSEAPKELKQSKNLR